MHTPRRITAIVLSALLATTAATAAVATSPRPGPAHAHQSLLATGLSGGGGSTVGPDGALYVTEPQSGEVSRIDRRTGQVSTFASGLPEQTPETPGGALDVAFLGRTAYVLVTLADPEVSGLYRVGRGGSVTPVADIGAWSVEHPPETDFFVPSGVQFALETYRGAFLVTDGHHNRVLRVTPRGAITEVLTLGNVVPTGLEKAGRTVLVAQAGPVPHLPQDGKVVAFRPGRSGVHEVASGGVGCSSTSRRAAAGCTRSRRACSRRATPRGRRPTRTPASS
ncbi:hypothetical protein ACQFYA_03025 [Promicromonospora sp. Marseille-Q5078]